MSAWMLPAPVARFLRAAQSNNVDTLCAAIPAGAALVVSGCSLDDTQTRAWAARFLGTGPRRIVPVGCLWREDSLRLTLLIVSEGGRKHEPQEWHFAISGDLVAWIAIAPHRMAPFPPEILMFIRSVNSGDLESLLCSFGEDAIVNDQLIDHWGNAAIRAWAASDVVAANLRIAVATCIEHYGSVVISARISGSFERRGLRDPLLFTFQFSTSGGKIVRLTILRNLAAI